MHANDGSVAENWIIERGGWQLDRVSKVFGYMLGTTQADQQVSRVLGGWKPKDGARLPSLAALDAPILRRALKMQKLLFSNTMAFADPALNLDEAVADVLTATLFMHFLDMLRLYEGGPLITKMREVMTERAIGELELLAWSVTIRQAFMPPPVVETSSINAKDQSAALVNMIKRQTEQIDVLVLQNKRLDERKLAVEAQLRTLSNNTASDSAGSDVASTVATADQPPPRDAKTVCSKKKGSQSMSAIGFEWFTAEHRVYASRFVKKTALYEYRHIAGYMMLFLPMGLALDTSSPAYKSEVLELGKKAQENTPAFLKSHGSSADEKLDEHITQFHERVERGDVADPTPSAALPAFI